MNIDCGPCAIRSWRFGDEDNLHQHANSRPIWLNLRDTFPHPYTEIDAQRWIQYVVDPELETNFAIDVGGQAVGNIGLRIGEDIERYSAEIWYWLGEAFWGRGIVSAALRTITEYAFTEFSLTRLYAKPMAHNVASIKVLEKVGFQREGLLRWSVVKDGVMMDTFMYSYLSSDWLAENGNLT
ncbi:GNAT family N-acetyltransferase [Spirosoma sp. BT702]|uniref:GNAT family N-acetyltransferase n=1 Tax=Spirosoma profusum TaxID=2771354 RepID=A0A926XSK9_9BACT|nr:GNAT family protein [Spirosoma profusum]MBD2699154.1 GNAT family N-acetyltransferase [Spirosoma profusum]